MFLTIGSALIGLTFWMGVTWGQVQDNAETDKAQWKRFSVLEQLQLDVAEMKGQMREVLRALSTD